MISLGIKEAVINDFADWAVSFTLAGVASTAALGDKMHIQGFGTFTGANLVAGASSSARKVDWVKEISTVTLAVVPAADEVYVVQFFVRTTRYQSEFANDFIKQGRPIVVEVVGDNTKVLAELVEDALIARSSLWTIGDANPFTTSRSTTTLTNTVVHQSLHIEKVLFRAKAALLDTSAAVTVTAEGTEGQGNGSQVEESVRMGFGENVNPYGIKAGTNVSVGGAYSELFWKVDVGVSEKVGFLLDGAPLNRQVSFNVFANESGNIAAAGPIESILEFLMTNGGITLETATSTAQAGVFLPDGTNPLSHATVPVISDILTKFIA